MKNLNLARSNKLNAGWNNLAVLLLVTLITVSCSRQSAVNNEMSIGDTDRYYSALSAKSGRNAAFLAMFDSAGVMLTGHRMPVKGLNHISELLLSRSDTSYTLTWEPVFESVAQSGELGYTYGTYRVTDKLAKRLLEEGTYATIWRKNALGEWKAVLDTGNEGLKPENK